jgi:hypothetical protein
MTNLFIPGLPSWPIVRTNLPKKPYRSNVTLAFYGKE